MTTPHMLDTDIASYVIRNRSPAIVAKLAAFDPSALCISVITKAELLYGLKRLAPVHLLHAGVRKFLIIVPALSWPSEAATEYAQIRHSLTTTGQPIGELDMMIAAHAIAIGAILVTNNTRHFARIKAPLAIVNWT